MDLVIKIIVVGIFATVIIDIWATFSNRLFKLPRTNWAMVGRWLGHLPNGKFIHNPVSASPKINYENIIGWMFHYLIGVIYAALYVVVVIWGVGNETSLLTAWIFGLFTLLSPWLILQPALGLGIFAVKAPRPNMVRLQNFSLHSIFGIALYYGWLNINL
ncbi:MAG: DUF2938 domain-containing protein [Colwellia sp.]|nr:DUF2938 domain-containing protein [Colwellia sp.]